MRTTKEIRDRLEAAATASGRSLAQEVEFRLEAWFSNEKKNELTHQVLMDNIYEQFGGIHIYSLMKLLAGALRLIEEQTKKSWLNDSETYDQGMLRGKQS